MKQNGTLLTALLAFAFALVLTSCSREESDWRRWDRVVSAKKMSRENYTLEITKVSESFWVASFTEKKRTSMVFRALIDAESNRVVEWVIKLANGHEFQVPANGHIERVFSVLQVDGKDVIR